MAFDLLFIFELIAQVEHLHFNLPFSVVLENSLVGLPLLVAQRIEVLGVGVRVLARLHVRKIALDIARGSAAARRGETDVVGHDDACDWTTSGGLVGLAGGSEYVV